MYILNYCIEYGGTYIGCDVNRTGLKSLRHTYILYMYIYVLGYGIM